MHYDYGCYLVVSYKVDGWVGEFKVAQSLIVELHGINGDDAGSAADKKQSAVGHRSAGGHFMRPCPTWNAGTTKVS